MCKRLFQPPYQMGSVSSGGQFGESADTGDRSVREIPIEITKTLPLVGGSATLPIQRKRSVRRLSYVGRRGKREIPVAV